MDKNINELRQQIRQFQQYLKEAESDKSTDNIGSNADHQLSVIAKNQQQQQFRNSAYEKGWINFAVIGPEPAIEHMKLVWAKYRADHPGLWGDEVEKSTDGIEQNAD